MQRQADKYNGQNGKETKKDECCVMLVMYAEVADCYYRNLCQREVVLIRENRLMERDENTVKHIKTRNFTSGWLTNRRELRPGT